jgi:hypothetical protein
LRMPRIAVGDYSAWSTLASAGQFCQATSSYAFATIVVSMSDALAYLHTWSVFVKGKEHFLPMYDTQLTPVIYSPSSLSHVPITGCFYKLNVLIW